MSKHSLYQSFKYAWQGIKEAFSTERNLKIQMFVGGVVVGSSFLLSLSRVEKIIVLLICGTIMTLELFNTGTERLLDKLYPHFDKEVGAIKDIMAGVVLFASSVAVIAGVAIFWSPVSQLIFG